MQNQQKLSLFPETCSVQSERGGRITINTAPSTSLLLTSLVNLAQSGNGLEGLNNTKQKPPRLVSVRMKCLCGNFHVKQEEYAERDRKVNVKCRLQTGGNNLQSQRNKRKGRSPKGRSDAGFPEHESARSSKEGTLPVPTVPRQEKAEGMATELDCL